jgi:hypothetical protein
MTLEEARLILAGHYTASLEAVEEAERMVMEASRGVECSGPECTKTSEIDEPSGMALESGWLKQGRGPGALYFCSGTCQQALRATKTIGR